MSGNAYALIHEEGGAYGISFPDFLGCVSGGAALYEALARGRETLAFHVAGIVEDSEDAVIVAVPVQLPGRLAGRPKRPPKDNPLPEGEGGCGAAG